jgi:hypothetical protein
MNEAVNLCHADKLGFKSLPLRFFIWWDLYLLKQSLRRLDNYFSPVKNAQKYFFS